MAKLRLRRKKFLRLRVKMASSFKVLQVYSCVSLSAVTQYLEMRLKVISPRVVELQFTVPIVIISRVKKVMSNV